MFEFLKQEFGLNAFLAGTMVAIIAAVVGYFVALRAQAFASEALADIGFAGVTGAAALGIGALPGMLILTILAALGMGALGERIRGRDVEIGMILSFALGLGVLFLAIYAQSGSNSSEGINALFGSILSVTRGDLVITLVSGCAVLLALGLLFRPLLFASIDPEVAQARGVPVRLLSVAFLVIVGITTAEAVLVIGVLLALALLIAPAATALRLTHRPLTSILLAIVLGVGITWGGLLLTFNGTGRHLPVGFYIATLSAAAYLLSIPLSRLRFPRRYRPLPHPTRECGPVAEHR
jgi:zinc/manganese transport system permease protein